MHRDASLACEHGSSYGRGQGVRVRVSDSCSGARTSRGFDGCSAQRVLTAVDLAARLNVSVETVYRMCRARKWPHSRIGRLYRFTEEHYQAIIAVPDPPLVPPRSQRENIARLLRDVP